MSETTFNLASAVDACLALALKQDESLSAKAKPIAQAIASMANGDARDHALTVVFERFYAPRVSAKRTGNANRAREIGRAFNRFRTLIGYHLKAAGLAAQWPNIASGDGEATIRTLAEAKADAEEKRAATEERENQAIAEAEARNTAEKLAALRELGPADIAAQINAMVSAWGGDPLAVWNELGLAVETKRHIPKPKAPAKAPAKAVHEAPAMLMQPAA